MGAAAKPGRALIEEAIRILHGDRAECYGDIFESFSRIACFWTTYLGVEISAVDVAQMMLLLKVSRQRNRHKRDNVVDQINYAIVTGLLNDEV